MSVSDLKTLQRAAAPLEQTLAYISSAAWMETLIHREQMLGVDTISAQGMQILHDQLTALCLPWSILWHESSLTAHEKQAILATYDTSLLVNKTITVLLGNDTLALITGVGDFSLQRPHILQLGQQLGLTRKQSKHSTLNPEWFHPEEYLHLRTGMVSPFFCLKDDRPCLIQAIALLPWAKGKEQDSQVAISLSLSESLVVPLWAFRSLVYGFAQQAYPFLPLLSLPSIVEQEQP